MDDALLPIDVCEDIIDHCDSRKDIHESFKENYGTLRACALVCSAWLPRSRRNLLREVRFGQSDHVDLLLDLLTEHPRLAELVTAIHIVGYEYLPFARFPLPHLLPNCCHLVIDTRVDWGRSYPPGYSRYMTDFRGLTKLLLSIAGLSAPELFHVVWSLPLLRWLTLADEQSKRLERFAGELRERRMVNRKPESCRQLRNLSIESDAYAPLLCTENLLPQGCFGYSVTRLKLRMTGYTVVSASFLECVGDFMNLRSLDVMVYDPAYKTHPITPVLQILPHVQSGPEFQELRVRLRQRITLHPTGGATLAYDLTRPGFLDIVCGAEMQGALGRFPSICAFFLHIDENDREHDTQWWTKEIVSRLPDLPRDVLQIQLDVQDSDILVGSRGIRRLPEGESRYYTGRIPENDACRRISRCLSVALGLHP